LKRDFRGAARGPQLKAFDRPADPGKQNHRAHSVDGTRARHRARRRLLGAPARPRRREGRRPGRRGRHAPRAEPLPIDGTVVIGEGERDEAPMLFIGEEVGTKTGPKVDIAVDPLEGTTLCAKDMPGSIAVMAMAAGGSLLNAPDVYMDKIAIGPGYPNGIVDLDMTPEDNIRALAKAKGVKPNESPR
jgi:hypothetical protein